MLEESAGRQQVTAGIQVAPTTGRQLQPRSVWSEVSITKVVNGWIVCVGCKTFVETSWKKIEEGLRAYWIDPVKAEEMFDEREVDVPRV